MTEALAQVPFTVTAGPLRHAQYAELAASAPIHRIMLPSGEPAWLITNYAQARRALHDSRLVKSPVATGHVGRDLVPPEVFAAMANHMLNLNPPDHTRLRRLVTTAFTRRRIEQLAPRIQQITDELVDVLATETFADLITSLALPLPIAVICELVGVPANQRAEFHDWSSTVVTGVLAGPDALAAAITALVSYLRELVEIKRALPPMTCSPRW